MTKYKIVEIKKYANRRLYDTAQSAYITLADLAHIIQSGCDVVISDAKTGEDLTATTLLQLVSERQQQSAPLLSAKALMRLIAYDIDETRYALSAHIEDSLKQFVDKQSGTLSDQANTDKEELETMREALKTLHLAFAKLDQPS